MHYTEIAEAIAEQGLRSDLGATPATSVSATIAAHLEKEVVRVTRGYYALAPSSRGAVRTSEQPLNAESDETGLINAFGMYWARSLVLWSPTPRILGQQQPSSNPVDFCGQRGVYLLHDGRDVVYVGRTTDQALGSSLRQHTVDRLNGRWDRFSWFGVFAPSESGVLNTSIATQYGLEDETLRFAQGEALAALHWSPHTAASLARHLAKKGITRPTAPLLADLSESGVLLATEPRTSAESRALAS
jgi:hypothetical protein